MGYLVRIPVLALGLVLFAAPVSLAGDVEDVQAVFNQSLKAYNAKNVDGVYATFHDQVVAFGANGPFASDNTAAGRQLMATAFASLESVAVTPLNFQFRIFGDTAVAYGYYAAAFKPKDGPRQVAVVRATHTYAKSGEKWLMVSSHMSAIPSGN